MTFDAAADKVQKMAIIIWDEKRYTVLPMKAHFDQELVIEGFGEPQEEFHYTTLGEIFDYMPELKEVKIWPRGKAV